MDVSKDKIEEVLLEFGCDKDSLICILMEVQKLSDKKYISEEVARYIAKRIDVPHNQVYEVLTFFSALNDKPKGKYHIQLCDSTVCRVNKKDIIEEYLESALNIKVGDTTKDDMFTLDYTPCFGACDISPAIRINKKVYGNLTVTRTEEILKDLRGGNHE